MAFYFNVRTVDSSSWGCKQLCEANFGFSKSHTANADNHDKSVSGQPWVLPD